MSGGGRRRAQQAVIAARERLRRAPRAQGTPRRDWPTLPEPPVDASDDRPDVVVTWLQNDYPQVGGRPGEGLAHALVDEGLARRVAYVEPFVPARGEAALMRRPIRGGLDVYRAEGEPPPDFAFARAVVRASGLRSPVLLNLGVAETNWWFHHEFAPFCSRTILVTHDKIALWDAMADRRPVLERVRTSLARASDAVIGLSQGAIDDIPQATYVGHGRDEIWSTLDPAAVEEPSDLAALPRPRAVYVGALSMRIDVEAFRAIARAGVTVVLIGMSPVPAVEQLIDTEPNVHWLGPRHPNEVPAYTLHCDVGIIPHTDEPFTRSMEPHKAYNYACAGLRTVSLNAEPVPALEEMLVATDTLEDFVQATRAALEQPLGPDARERALGLTWARVARSILST